MYVSMLISTCCNSILQSARVPASMELSICIGVTEKSNTTLIPGLHRMFNDRVRTDVTFHVDGGQQISAHRIVLASQSEYFECLLYGKMKEGTSSEINLEGTPADAFRELLRYLYAGSISHLPLSTTLDLHLLADRFAVLSLKEMIELALKRALSTENVLYIYSHAHHLSESYLQQKCEDFVDNHAGDIVKDEAVKHVQKHILQTLLNRDTLLLENELLIFDAVWRWIQENGHSEAEVLLNCVRLTEIEREALETIVLPSGLYKKEQVVEAMKASPRVRTRGLVMENMELLHTKPTVLYSHHYLLDDLNNSYSLWHNLNFDVTEMTRPVSPQEPAELTIEFRNVVLVNKLMFSGFSGRGYEVTDRTDPFCYKIMVSIDGNTWEMVLDYSKIWCYGYQKLFFKKMAIRYLRILQNLGVHWCTYRLKSCQYVGPDIPFAIREGGVLAPTVPLSVLYTECLEKGKDKSLATLHLTFHQPYAATSISIGLRGMFLKDLDCNIKFTVSKQKRKRAYKVVGELREFNLKDNFELSVCFQERVITILNIDFSEIRIRSKDPPQPPPNNIDLLASDVQITCDQSA